MWERFAKLILKNRVVILLMFLIVTLFMGWKSTGLKLSYAGSKILPVTDSAFIAYNAFKEKFGEDGSIMVLGVESPSIFKKDLYNQWSALTNAVKKVNGVTNVLSTGNLIALTKDTVNQKFGVKFLPSKTINSAQEMDSLASEIRGLTFYNGLLFNERTHAALMAISFDKKLLNTVHRNKIIEDIQAQADLFTQKTGLEVHVSGLPYIRTATSKLVSNEFVLFLGLSILVSAIILLVFFRNIFAVLFPVLVVVMGVVWSLGCLVLFGYEITTLTGLIPPLIVIIGIPNSILILNKYKAELLKGKAKIEAIEMATARVSITTLIANVTAAIGFGVLCFTGSNLLVEFGAVAALNVMFTWIICLCLIPIIFSWLPKLKVKKEVHKASVLDKILDKVDYLVANNRRLIYVTTIVLVLISLIGVMKIRVNGYVVDDLPSESSIQRDIKFFEKNFEGILPLEISVDTRKNNGVLNLSTLKRIEKVEDMIAAYPEFSKSISINSGVKYATQTFFNGDPEFYRLPSEFEKNFILQYVSNSGKGDGNMLNNFVSSDKRIARISFQMADVGSERLGPLLDEIKLRTDSILNPKRYDVSFTGSSIIFSRGTDYMLEHLIESICLAIVLISIIRFFQFKSIGIMLISLLPNVVPLIITAGIMGYFGIDLKPSTILIFTIAFGLASDQTIYFLTHYQQELKFGKHDFKVALSNTIKESGVSMTHIAFILFFGFGIFTASTFGGTVVLGMLLSITLLVALVFNLTLLPALVRWLAMRK